MNAKSGKFPEKGWVIEDGCLKHVAKGGGGDIITRGKYEQFDFRFEWKVAGREQWGEVFHHPRARIARS